MKKVQKGVENWIINRRGHHGEKDFEEVFFEKTGKAER